MDVKGVAWEQLSPDAQRVLELAVGSEADGVAGTRALLAGAMLASPAGEGEVDELLRHFGLTRDELFDLLGKAWSAPFEPGAPSRVSPDAELPLTPKGAEAFTVAARLAEAVGDRAIEPKHVVGGLLQVPDGTALGVLARLLPSVQLPEVAQAYVDHLYKHVPFAELLDERFPVEPAPEESAEPPPAQGAEPEPLRVTGPATVVVTFATQVLPEPADLGAARGAVLYAALRSAVDRNDTTSVAGRLPAVLDEGELPAADLLPRLERVAAALGATTIAFAEPAEPAAVAGPYYDLVARAEELRARSGAEALGVHHVLAEAVGHDPPTLPEPALEALGVRLLALRRALRTVVAELAPEERAEAWDAILAEAPAEFDLAGGVSPDAVDPTRGIPLEQDHLGVRTYVAMLAAVIADSRTPEPLSIGLFGEWGSGKSTFMGLLREQVEQLARRGPPYYRGIRQIGFNAWHYADTNIWASLGDEIFEQLAGPDEPVEERRRRLRDELAERLQRRKELEVATDRAQEETARLSRELDKARAAGAVSARKLAGAAAASPALRAELDEAWRRLGVKDEVERGRLLAGEVRGAAEDVDTLRLALGGRRGIVLLTVAAVLVAAVAVAAVLEPEAARWLAGSGTAALAGVLSAALWLVGRVRSGLRILREVDAAAAQATLAEPLEALRRAEANERVLAAQRDKVVERVGELGRELAQLSPGQRLYGFVSERAESEEYRRHLGVISTVRKDFEQLVDLLKDWRGHADDGDETRPRIDRIVLYIDDLDRCSSRQVVEVLQAVHLLLALDLFVVVVGVDPRWLLRSLQTEYADVLTSDPDEPAERWEASPHDYLEKIFNIPFALPRMTQAGFEQLLRSFTAGDRRTDGGPPTIAQPPGTEPPEARVEPVRGGPGIEPAPLPAEARSEVAAVTRGEAVEVRQLTEPEIELLASLAPLLSTPREAKRLANLYRLVRSTRDLSPASRFLGDDSTPGQYQAVVVLLGLLSGHGRLLEDVLAAQPVGEVAGGLVHREPTSTWREFVAGIAPSEVEGAWRNDVVGALAPADVAPWRQLQEGLAGATERVTLPDLTAFQLWAPLVARFSFLLSPYVAAGADLPAAGASQPASRPG